MKNILITNYRGENVMVYTNLDVAPIKAKLDKDGEEYGDIFEVPDNEVSFYVFEPLWLEEKTEKILLSA